MKGALTMSKNYNIKTSKCQDRKLRFVTLYYGGQSTSISFPPLEICGCPPPKNKSEFESMLRKSGIMGGANG